MTRHTRAVVLVAAVALAFLAAVNVGAAKPQGPSVRQAPCAPSASMTFPCTATAGNGASQVVNDINALQAFFGANGGPGGAFSGGGGQPPTGGSGGGQQGGLPMCAPGQMPTPQAPCNTGGQQGGMPQGGGQQGGGQMGGGQMGGGGINWANLAPCAAGQMPTPQAPCKMEIPPCAEGQRPSPTAPCRPQGGMPGKEGEEMGGFDAPPTGDIQKDMKNKFMVIDINVQGSGEDPGTFDVTFRKVSEGVGKQTKDYLNSQLEGESFVIEATKKTICFADTKDADKVPDVVSCKELSDAADLAPGSIRAQFRGKVNFDPKTYSPKFTAQKIVFLKGVFNVAKID